MTLVLGMQSIEIKAGDSTSTWGPDCSTTVTGSSAALAELCLGVNKLGRRRSPCSSGLNANSCALRARRLSFQGAAWYECQTVCGAAVHSAGQNEVKASLATAAEVMAADLPASSRIKLVLLRQSLRQAQAMFEQASLHRWKSFPENDQLVIASFFLS